MAQPGSFVWTRRQRTVLASIVLILCGVFFVQALRHPTHIDDPPAPAGVAHNVVNAGRLPLRFVEVEFKPSRFSTVPQGDKS